MIYILLNWLIIGLTSLVAGKGLVLILEKHLFKEHQERVDFLYLTLAGLAFLSFAAGIYHLFLPLSPVFIHGILAAGVVLLPFLFRHYLNLKREKARTYQWVLTAVLGIIAVNRILDVANLSFIVPHHYDDGLYYRTFVHWLKEYPVIPGLGNLHFRLANNSTWHLLTAVYENTLFSGVRFNDLNGFLMALAIVYGLSGLYALAVHRVNTLTNYVRILILFLLLYPNGTTYFTVYNYGVVTSSTPDLPAAILTWYIFLLALHKAEQNTWYTFDLNTVLIVILVCFTITIKLSVAPLALLVVIIFLTNAASKKWKGPVAISLVALLFVSPWLVSNVIMSGYLVFPIYQIDLFSVDWKVPDALVKYAATNVGSWAKIPGVDRHTATLPEWVPGWYERLEEPREQYLWLVIYAHALYWGLLVMHLVAKRKVFYNSLPFLMIYLVMLTGTVVWFLNIPDFRFGFGFTFFPVILLIAILIKELLYDLRLAIGIGYTVYLLFNMSSGYWRLIRNTGSELYAEPEDEFPVGYKTIKLEYGQVYVPETGDQCWDIALPCAPFHYGIDGKSTRFRGKSLKAGFHFR